jgi:hypothetical protein
MEKLSLFHIVCGSRFPLCFSMNLSDVFPVRVSFISFLEFTARSESSSRQEAGYPVQLFPNLVFLLSVVSLDSFLPRAPHLGFCSRFVLSFGLG